MTGKILTAIVAVFLLSGVGGAMMVSMYDDWGSPVNERSYVIESKATPVQISMMGDLNRTLVIRNDDPEATVYYGDANVTVGNGVPLLPGETLVYHGKGVQFVVYFTSGYRSASLKAVSYQ